MSHCICRLHFTLPSLAIHWHWFWGILEILLGPWYVNPHSPSRRGGTCSEWCWNTKLSHRDKLKAPLHWFWLPLKLLRTLQPTHHEITFLRGCRKHAVDGGGTRGLFVVIKIHVSNQDKLNVSLHWFWLPLALEPSHHNPVEDYAVDNVGPLTVTSNAFRNCN